MQLSMSFKALWIIAALAPLFALYTLNRWNRPLEPSAHVLGVLERLGAGQDLRPSPDHRQFLSRPWFVASAADTTAVVLNWSRFSNVLDIAAVLCHPALADTIAEVLVWNNSPNKISVKDFAHIGCPRGKLRVFNSPENIYFQARFIACAKAKTPYCFIQDDDYLVLPEVIQAMHAQIRELPQPHPIYVLPPHEHLSSVLRRTFAPRAPPHVVHTSFAWLGHGALVPRADAATFLALMHTLNASETELRMADNYFALLANRVPEVWLDQGIELGRGQPFTVGSEGDERNKRHFRRAAEFLDQISGCRGEDCSAWTYANLSAVISPEVERDRLTKAACRGRPCVLETNIRLLPELDHIADRAQDVLEVETRNTAALGGDGHLRYVDFALSHAVDGSLTTAFKSRGHAAAGDYLSLDLLSAVASAEPLGALLLVDASALPILLASSLQTSSDGLHWDTRHASWRCKPRAGLGAQVQECIARSHTSTTGARHVRVVLTEGVARPWHVYHIGTA